MKPTAWPLVAPERLPTANQLNSGVGTLFPIADDGEPTLGVWGARTRAEYLIWAFYPRRSCSSVSSTC